MARFWCLALLFVVNSALLTTNALSKQEHYDLTLHYRPLQTELLEGLNRGNVEQKLGSIQAQLITKLSEVLEVEKVELKIYNIRTAGEELQRKTLIVHAELSLNLGRFEIVKRLQNQKSKHQLLIPYLKQINEPVKNALVSHKLLSKLNVKFDEEDDQPAKTCANGGILLPNSTCSCDSYFTGDDCSMIQCAHQGLVIESETEASRCLCPPGWVGRHCETLPGLPSASNSFDFSSRTLVLVLNNAISTTFDIQQTLFAISDYFNGASAERQNFYKNYILLSFVQFGDSYIDHQTEVTNYADFIQEIASIIPLEADEKQPILTATTTAIYKLQTTLPKSTILTVVDHLASDASVDSNSETSVTLESNLLKTALYWQHSMNVILTERADEKRADVPDDSYNSLKRLSHRCNGELADLGKSKKNVKEAVHAILQAQYKAETIGVRRDADFSQTLTFQLVNNKESLLYVSGKNFQLKDSRDAVINPVQNAGNFALYSLSNSQKDLKLVANGEASPTISYRAVYESDKQIYVAYTHNQEADATSVYSVSKIPHQVVLNAPQEFSTAKISGVSSSDSNNEIFGQTEMELRTTDSNFPMIAKTLINDCALGPFFTKIRFGDQQILVPSFCFDPDHHFNDAHANTCNNHGTWNDEKNKCDCQPFFDGTNCEKVLCQNGGKVNEFPGNGQPICFCDPGFNGDHCESMSCAQSATAPDFSTKSLSVVMQRSYSQAFLNTEIRDSVQNALNSLDKDHPDYFSNFILTTFVKAMAGKEPEIQIQKFTKSSDLVTALNAANVKYAITTDQEQSSLDALLQTLEVTEVANEQNRLVLLFVDSPPKNPSLIDKIKTIALKQSISFNILVSAPYGLDGNGECMESKYFDMFRDLSRSTSGLFFNLCDSYSTGSVKNFLTGFLRASYRYQAARKQTSNDCKSTVDVKVGDKTTTRYFLIDADETSINFDVEFGFNGQKVDISEIGKIDNIVLFKADNLEQKNYQLKVSASKASYCRITVAQESDLNLALGYTVNPSLDAANETIMFGYPLHPVVYLSTQLQSTAQLSLTVNGDSGYDEKAVIRNDNCVFEYYFLKAFSCPLNPGPFSIQVSITTEDGYYSERAFTSYCEKLNVPCLNGGTFSDSKCHCDDNHSGDYCEKPVCKNGKVSENKCECLEGYGGEFCEDLMCLEWDYLATHDTNNFEYQTIIFAIQNDQNSKDVNKQIIGGIQQFIDKVTTDTKGPQKHYSLLTFDNQNTQNIINTVDTSAFISTLTTQLNNPSDSNKAVKALQIMQLASEISVYKPAIVYVFFNSNPILGNPLQILEVLSLGGQQINVIFANPQGPSSGSGQYLKQVTTSSNGRYIWTDNVQDLLTKYLPNTVFENALLVEEEGLDCRQEQSYEFPVESRINWITILARGADVNKNIKLLDVNGKEVKTNVIVSDQGAFVATVDQASGAGGLKTLKLKTSKGECGLQVRASSELHAEVGFTRSIHDDFPNERPTVVSAKNGSTYITVKIGKSLMSHIDVLPSHVQLLTRDLRTGNDMILGESDLIPRDFRRCANQYITYLMDIPIAQYKAQQKPLFVKITGKEKDENFQRIQLYFPIPIQCQNGADFDEFGYCTCPATYGGDDCTIPRCQNDGVVDLTVCACKSGFHGPNCELSVA